MTSRTRAGQQSWQCHRRLSHARIGTWVPGPIRAKCPMSMSTCLQVPDSQLLVITCSSSRADGQDQGSRQSAAALHMGRRSAATPCGRRTWPAGELARLRLAARRADAKVDHPVPPRPVTFDTGGLRHVYLHWRAARGHCRSRGNRIKQFLIRKSACTFRLIPNRPHFFQRDPRLISD